MEGKVIKHAQAAVTYELVCVLKRVLGLLCEEQMEADRRGSKESCKDGPAMVQVKGQKPVWDGDRSECWEWGRQCRSKQQD